MNELAIRLLELQTEYQNRDELAGAAKEFRSPDFAPRTVEAIAADYADTLQQFIVASR